MSVKRRKNGSFRLEVWDDGDGRGMRASLSMAAGVNERGKPGHLHSFPIVKLGHELYKYVSGLPDNSADNVADALAKALAPAQPVNENDNESGGKG